MSPARFFARIATRQLAPPHVAPLCRRNDARGLRRRRGGNSAADDAPTGQERRTISLRVVRLRLRFGRALLAIVLLPHAGRAARLGREKWRKTARFRVGSRCPRRTRRRRPATLAEDREGRDVCQTKPTTPSCCHAKAACCKSSSNERTCCSSHSKPHDKTEAANFIVAWRALGCHGQSLNWLAAVPTLISDQTQFSDQLPLVAWLGPHSSEIAAGVADVPTPPPPERA